MDDPLIPESENSPTKNTNNSYGNTRNAEDYHQTESYKAFIEELEELKQEFLLRNYATVWSGCLELIVKLIRLSSPIGTPTLQKEDFKSLPIVEAWKSLCSPEADDAKEPSESIMISLHLWTNAWSLIITLIGKWHEQSQVSNKRRISSFSSQKIAKEGFRSPVHRFSIENVDAIEDRIYSMDRNLESIWGCLSQFYHPDPHAIPPELILAITLVAVKQERLQTADKIVTSWLKSIPETWQAVMKATALRMDWEEEKLENDKTAKFCLHYDSIMTLYVAHVLVGQQRWNEAPEFLHKDPVLPRERKLLIIELLDQAKQEHEAMLQRNFLPVHPTSAVAVVSQTNSENSFGISAQAPSLDRNQLASKGCSSIGAKKESLLKWLNSFSNKVSHNFSFSVFSSALAMVVILILISRRNKLKPFTTGAFSGGWGTYWLYRILKSIRPALPPTSGGPDSI